MPLHITMKILGCIGKCDKYAVKNRKVNIVNITLILHELARGSHVHTPKVKSNMCIKFVHAQRKIHVTDIVKYTNVHKEIVV